MDCKMWESTGLLFSSNELSPKETVAFEKHLVACAACADKVHRYNIEKQRLFSIEMLGELPSEKTSQEIIKLCSVPAIPAVSLSFFSMVLRKTTVPVLSFFILGIGAGSYFMYATNQQKTLSQIARQAKPVDNTLAISADKDSSNADSSGYSGDSRVFSNNRRSNADDYMQQVIPVELKKE